MRSFITVSLALVLCASAALISKHTQTSVWSVANFNSLITFGDSYTDENRLNYFALHNGSAPPAGLVLPESSATASGGRTWPRYVIQYTGATTNREWVPQMTLYNYAVSGAVCSNDIVQRYFATINAPFPDVLGYEIPAFLADQKANRSGTSKPFFQPALTADNAVYSMWIGTNDLGVYAYLTNSQTRGNVLSDYTSCVYKALDEIYAAGGRIFVLFSTAPLQLAPLYANETLDGVRKAAKYWPDKPDNLTEIAEIIHEYTTSVNTIYKYQTPFEALVSQRYPDASFAVFNVWQLISDIYDNPSEYLNGTQPANVTGFDNHCANATSCTRMYNGSSPDSFLWYDELHPRLVGLSQARATLTCLKVNKPIGYLPGTS